MLFFRRKMMITIETQMPEKVNLSEMLPLSFKRRLSHFLKRAKLSIQSLSFKQRIKRVHFCFFSTDGSEKNIHLENRRLFLLVIFLMILILKCSGIDLERKKDRKKNIEYMPQHFKISFKVRNKILKSELLQGNLCIYWRLCCLKFLKDCEGFISL